MSPSAKANYVKGVVICHGKSEQCLSRYITSNLHLNIKPFAKDKGRHSIQITGLMSVLNSKPFNTKKAFLEEYPVETLGKGKSQKLINFKLFIMMDTDDCTEKQKNDFINRTMFSNHWLSEYIVPIYSIASFEDVMIDAGITSTRVSDSEKGETYSKIFPINDRPLSTDTLNEVKTFGQRIRPSKKSNLILFIDYCLDLLNK